MDGILSGMATVMSSAADAITITLGGYTSSEHKRIEQLMAIFDDRKLCKMIVRIESKKRIISWNELKSFNSALQKMDMEASNADNS